MKRFLVSLWLVSWMAVTSPATTVVPMSVERLTQASTAVVEGTAESSWSAWNAAHTVIYTYTRVRVTRSLKGQLPERVTVKQMGGVVGPYQQKVAGVRALRTGDQAMLFVHPSQAADGTLVVTGLMQGDFRIQASQSGEAMASNGVEGVEQFTPGQVASGHFSGSRMPLQLLESLVRKAAGAEQK